MDEHKHKWLIVTKVEAQSWDDFMRFRGEEKDRMTIIYKPTHMMMCSICFELKKVD